MEGNAGVLISIIKSVDSYIFSNSYLQKLENLFRTSSPICIFGSSIFRTSLLAWMKFDAGSLYLKFLSEFCFI